VSAPRETAAQKAAREVSKADDGLRLGEPLPEDWSPQDWITGVNVQLGRAAAAAGTGELAEFTQHMAAVAASATHAVEQAIAGNVERKRLL
jgi:hypothetical protein